MARDIKIGVCIRFKAADPWPRRWTEIYEDNIAYAARAEALGFDGVWVPEHHGVASGYNPAPFLALTALARATKTCMLGTQPLLLPLHNPVLVAEEAAVLDVLSHGRLILGIGAGYRQGDFEMMGIDKRLRGARMEEATGLLIKMFTATGPFDFDGRFFQVKGGALYPKPVQTPYPEIQIIARSEAAARRAVRHATALNLHRRDVVRALGPMVAAETAKAGRDPSTVKVTVLRHGFLGADRESAVATAKPFLTWNAREHGAWWSENPDPDDHTLFQARVVGADSPPGDFTPEDWLAGIAGDIAAITETGLRPDWVNVNIWPPGMTLADGLACLERFAETVLRPLRRSTPR